MVFWSLYRPIETLAENRWAGSGGILADLKAFLWAEVVDQSYHYEGASESP